jgi:hypothetical protein
MIIGASGLIGGSCPAAAGDHNVTCMRDSRRRHRFVRRSIRTKLFEHPLIASVVAIQSSDTREGMSGIEVVLGNHHSQSSEPGAVDGVSQLVVPGGNGEPALAHDRVLAATGSDLVPSRPKKEAPVYIRPGLPSSPPWRTEKPYRQKSASNRMMGSGMPSNQSKAPRPKLMVILHRWT